MNFLEFERPIAELEARITELRHSAQDDTVNLSEEIDRLQAKCDALAGNIFAKLSPWQIAQLARHPDRPYTLDFVARLFTGFQELHGDRAFADDEALVGGVCRFAGSPVMVIGHQKGRDTAEKIRRNFGMPRPEGYRKARRLMELAERFDLPLITFIDTPGAYPGIDAEERGQSAAIAENLRLMSQLQVPVISIVIGEGGSGGALAIGVCDHLVMLQYATYAVISPEGCAAILWKSNEKADLAAQAMGITAARLSELELVDEVVGEPVGGAHRDWDATAEAVRGVIGSKLSELQQLPKDQLVLARQQRLAGYGTFSSG